MQILISDNHKLQGDFIIIISLNSMRIVHPFTEKRSQWLHITRHNVREQT